MLDFGYFADTLLPFIGRIFGLISWLGSISLGDFLTIIDRLWVPDEVVYFTNVLTGAVESIGTTGFNNVFFSPFILYVQAFIAPLAKGVLWIIRIPYETPLWVVACTYLLFLTVVFGFIRGIGKLLINTLGA